jgi:hypothetical protein
VSCQAHQKWVPPCDISNNHSRAARERAKVNMRGHGEVDASARRANAFEGEGDASQARIRRAGSARAGTGGVERAACAARRRTGTLRKTRCVGTATSH